MGTTPPKCQASLVGDNFHRHQHRTTGAQLPFLDSPRFSINLRRRRQLNIENRFDLEPCHRERETHSRRRILTLPVNWRTFQLTRRRHHAHEITVLARTTNRLALDPSRFTLRVQRILCIHRANERHKIPITHKEVSKHPPPAVLRNIARCPRPAEPRGSWHDN